MMTIWTVNTNESVRGIVLSFFYVWIVQRNNKQQSLSIWSVHKYKPKHDDYMRMAREVQSTSHNKHNDLEHCTLTWLFALVFQLQTQFKSKSEHHSYSKWNSNIKWCEIVKWNRNVALVKRWNICLTRIAIQIIQLFSKVKTSMWNAVALKISLNAREFHHQLRLHSFGSMNFISFWSEKKTHK